MGRTNFHGRVYANCLSVYRNLLDDSQSIKDFNVIEHIENTPSVAVGIGMLATKPLLGIEKILTSNVYSPRFIIGSNENGIAKIIKAFEKENIHDFSGNGNDNILEIKRLSNMIIFYEEKGGFDIVEDLSYIKEMKKTYEQAVDGKTKEQWKNERSAFAINY